jgi:tetratricopeptide (TPR) repeat protein
VWWYVRHLAWPWQLGVFYDYSNVSGPALWTFVLPMLGLAAIAAIGVWLWHRNRSANLTILYVWFVLALAAYVAFSPMVRLHDRYLHLASYPFCVLVAWLILKAGVSEKRILLRSAGVLLVVGLWAGVTWSQSAYWRNDFTLWAHATRTASGMVEPWLHVAEAYSGDLRSMQAVQVIDEGLKHRPQSPSLWQIRGLLLYDRAQYGAAKMSFLKVLEVSARYDLRKFPDVLGAKTGALYYLGLIDMNAGDFASAERWLREAVTLRPGVAEFRSSLDEAVRKRADREKQDQK